VDAEPSKPELHENEPFQRAEWAVQRFAAFVFGLLLVAAALGVFGGGLLSRAHVEGGNASVEYERFLRRDRQSSMTIDAAASGDIVIIETAGPLFLNSDIQTLAPQPLREEALPDGVRYVFGSGADSSAHVTLRMTPRTAGPLQGTLRVNGTPLDLSCAVYP
jgi:hypothetical protein